MWKKCYRASHATDDNMAHAHSMLDNYGYKHTHSSCVTLIAFTQQQWLHESASPLRHKYIACPVRCYVLLRCLQLNNLYSTKWEGISVNPAYWFSFASRHLLFVLFSYCCKLQALQSAEGLMFCKSCIRKCVEPNIISIFYTRKHRDLAKHKENNINCRVISQILKLIF